MSVLASWLIIIALGVASYWLAWAITHHKDGDSR